MDCPLEFSHRKIIANGLRFHVVVEGEGPDVLLVHGFPDSHKVWRRQIPALVAAGYRVIAPDLRGFGATDMAAGPRAYQVRHFVDDLVAIVAALAVDKVRLVGHDMGAVIGWAFAIARPDLVERYAALSVGHPEAYPRGGLAQKLKGYYVPICASPVGAAFMRLANWGMFRLVTNYPPELALWKRDLERPGRLEAALGFYRNNLALVLSRKHGRVSAPTMGVWSSGDHALARKQMAISGEYVDAAWRYEEMHGAGHWLQLDQPALLNTLLLDFLANEPAVSMKPIHAC